MHPPSFTVHLRGGSTFGLLFQRDVRGYGSSLGWGFGYGIFWWFLGPFTLKPLLQGQAPNWTLAQGQELFGSLMGHIVYGLIVGVIYAALDRLWVGFFIDSDPINRHPQGPGPHQREACPSLGFSWWCRVRPCL